jgi:hypothetical protein
LSLLPFPNLVHHRVGDSAYQVGRHIHLVDLLKVGWELRSRWMSRFVIPKAYIGGTYGSE